MKPTTYAAGSVILIGCTVAAALRLAAPTSPQVWGYGGGPAQIRYSPLSEITRDNVDRLEVAWTYDTGEAGALQTQPLVVDHVLYGYTPTHKTFAIDAATGERLWMFDSGIAGSGPNRGLMFWADRDERVFSAVGDFIYALDAATGNSTQRTEPPGATMRYSTS